MNKELHDKVWAVLPQEFKEEVKALYAKARNIYDIYTSATCINNTESKAIDICNGKMQVLRELFGALCLPDEVANNQKFLVGEKVIISDDPRIGKDFRGRIGTVAFINSTDQRTVDVGNGVFDCFHISHLAPYIEPKQENTLFSENVKNENNGNHIVENENKQPENDKKDLNLSFFVSPTEKQYHIMVAAEAMKGMLANTNIIMSCGDLENSQEYITKHAVEYADALIKEINGKGDVLNGIIIDGKVYEAVSNGSRHCSDCDCYKECSNEPLKYAGICMGFNSQNKVIFRFSKELTDKIK